MTVLCYVVELLDKDPMAVTTETDYKPINNLNKLIK